jgi:hypothetical protein
MCPRLDEEHRCPWREAYEGLVAGLAEERNWGARHAAHRYTDEECPLCIRRLRYGGDGYIRPPEGG